MFKIEDKIQDEAKSLQQRFEAQLYEDLKCSEQEIEAGFIMSLSSVIDLLRRE